MEALPCRIVPSMPESLGILTAVEDVSPELSSEYQQSMKGYAGDAGVHVDLWSCRLLLKWQVLNLEMTSSRCLDNSMLLQALQLGLQLEML